MPPAPYRDPNNYVKVSGRMAEKLAETEPNGAIWANQFDNVANRDGHYRTTGPEIWDQTGGGVDGFICAIGSGGTLAGVAMALRERRKDVQIGLADPMGAALWHYYVHGELKAEGDSITEGIGQGRITANIEGLEIDHAYRIDDREAPALLLRPAAIRGPVPRRQQRHQHRRRGPPGRRDGAGPHHRHRAVRLRQPVPEQDVQPGLPARKGPARAAMAGGIESRMTYANPSALVSTQWLADHLDAPDVRVVDASWYLPAMNRDAKAEYANAHIPGAVYFDIDEIADTESPYPHTLPSPEKFSSRVRRLGLGDGNRIVVYDGAGIFSAPRVWWMFRRFGHGDVAVLDGGFPKWLKEGRPTEALPPMPQERHFTPRIDNTMARDLPRMRKIVAENRQQIADARSYDRYTGEAKEPRPGSGIRSHPRQPEPAVPEAAGRRQRHDAAGRRAGGGVPGCRDRPRQARGGDLRVRRFGLHAGPRPASARPPGRRGLRRLLERMGGAARCADRHRAPDPPHMADALALARIRPCTDDDSEAIAALWRKAGLTRPWNDPAQDIARCRRAPNAELLVAEIGGAVVGSVMAGHDGHRGWVYYTLAVDPDVRRQGLGRRLMRRAEKWLKDAGAPKVQLMVRAENAPVRTFYDTLGYTESEVVTLEKWLDGEAAGDKGRSPHQPPDRFPGRLRGKARSNPYLAGDDGAAGPPVLRPAARRSAHARRRSGRRILPLSLQRRRRGLAVD